MISNVTTMSHSKLGVIPSVRIGDLLWCREAKSTKVWWPAMVTYDPKLAIYFRTLKSNSFQYHVQYFGISAYRGWVNVKSTLEFTDPQEKPLPDKGVSKKTRAEYEVAIQEILEAKKLDHKQRKLKFTFNFSPVPLRKPSSKASETADQKPSNTKVSQDVKQECAKPARKSTGGTKIHSLPVSINVKVEVTGPGDPGLNSAHPSMKVEPASESSKRLGESIRGIKPVSVEFPVSSKHSESVATSRSIVRCAPSLKRPLEIQAMEADIPLKRPALQDLGGCVNDNSSEISAPSISSAILTPPNSCTEEEPPLVNFEFEHPVKGSEVLPEGSKASSHSRSHQKVAKPDIPTLKLGTCSLCDESNAEDLLLCEGQCYRTFHMDCLGLIQLPTSKFVCDECLIASSQCFVCGETDGELLKCNKPKCSKLYHLSCVEANKLVSFDERKKQSFTCPLHVCARCTSIGTSKVHHYNLLQCIKCPLALHRPDCLVAGCEILSQTHMVCYQHVKIRDNVQLYNHLNLNTCLECGTMGTLFCCDSCAAAYHCECLEEDARPGSNSENWKCPNCSVHDLPTYGSVVICKYGRWR